MIQVSLDTSFLISFADPSRPCHSVAVEYFRHCVAQQIPMWLSVVAAGEYEVKDRVVGLPLKNFRILEYNLAHAITAARLFRELNHRDGPELGPRRVILNDLKIIAQASEEDIPVILTEDRSTLEGMCRKLSAAAVCSVRAVLLADGFAPDRLTDQAGDLFCATDDE